MSDKRVFKFYAKIRNCNVVFHDDLPPGCVAMREFSFTPKSKQVDEMFLFIKLQEKTREMLEDYFYVEQEEIK